MKALLALITMGMLALSGTAFADHDDRRRGYAPRHHWAHDHASDFARRRGYGVRPKYGQVGRNGFARWYADTALAQARQNHRYGCRERGNAWTTDWYDHYRWAMRVSRNEAMQQVEIRDRRLGRCGAYSYRR
jgi:hypothetical protein